MILDIARHTPVWVYLMFFGLLAISALRLRGGIRDVRRVAIVPAIFIIAGVVGLFARHDPVATAMWLVGALGGSLVGSLNRPTLQADRDSRAVWLPGSLMPTLRLLLIFGAHYLLNVAAALRPEQAAGFMHWDAAVSGMAAGFFAAWSLRFHQAWKVAPAITDEHRTATGHIATT